jgi:hypothetical protein
MNYNKRSHTKRKNLKRNFFIPSLQMLESRETPSVSAVADSFTNISPYVPTVLNVLQNDVNPDGSGFTLIGNTSVTPAGPSLSQNPDGTFTFNSPNAGNFSFDYTISGKLHQLTSPDNSTTDDFGRSIAMSADGNTMVIGAPNDNIGSNIDQGSAYIFTKTPSGWIQQAQLVAPNPQPLDKFGSSVDITADGNTVVIKAVFQQQNTYYSKIFLSSRSGSSWSIPTLLNLNASNSNYVSVSTIGGPVVISGDGSTIFTQTSQNRYAIFHLDNSSWILQYESPIGIHSNVDATLDLSYDGNTAIFGTTFGFYDYDTNSWTSNPSGAAFVFSRSNNSWSRQANLFVTNPDSGDGFGYSASISADGNTAVIGAPGHGNSPNSTTQTITPTQDSQPPSPSPRMATPSSPQTLRFRITPFPHKTTLVRSSPKSPTSGSLKPTSPSLFPPTALSPTPTSPLMAPSSPSPYPTCNSLATLSPTPSSLYPGHNPSPPLRYRWINLLLHPVELPLLWDSSI